MTTIISQNDYENLKKIEFLYNKENEYILEGRIVDIYRKDVDWHDYISNELVLKLELYVDNEACSYEYLINSNMDICDNGFNEYFRLKRLLKDISYNNETFDKLVSENKSEELLNFLKHMLEGKVILFKKKKGDNFSDIEVKVIKDVYFGWF